MPEINYNQIFSQIDTFTGLPLHQRGNKWYGSCRFDGTKHVRRDKLCAYMKSGKIRIIEQGEQSLSLWDWLLEYGGCNSNGEVRERLLTLSSGTVTQKFTDEIVHAKHIKNEWIESTMGKYSDTLFSWLCTLFPKPNVQQAYQLYNVGSIGLRTVFWYKNFAGEYCFDKIMTYKPDGRRDKEIKPGRNYLVKDGYTDRCFFGEHLLEDWRKENFVVESEKTALLMYLHYGKKVIATGGSSCLAALGKGSILLPDYDKAGETWNDWGKVSEWWKRFSHVEEGWDIGDAIVEKIKRKA